MDGPKVSFGMATVSATDFDGPAVAAFATCACRGRGSSCTGRRDRPCRLSGEAVTGATSLGVAISGPAKGMCLATAATDLSTSTMASPTSKTRGI